MDPFDPPVLERNREPRLLQVGLQAQEVARGDERGKPFGNEAPAAWAHTPWREEKPPVPDLQPPRFQPAPCVGWAVVEGREGAV